MTDPPHLGFFKHLMAGFLPCWCRRHLEEAGLNGKPNAESVPKTELWFQQRERVTPDWGMGDGEGPSEVQGGTGLLFFRNQWDVGQWIKMWGGWEEAEAWGRTSPWLNGDIARTLPLPLSGYPDRMDFWWNAMAQAPPPPLLATAALWKVLMSPLINA